MKLFLDTNILIDKLSMRAPFADDVRQLCIAKLFGDVQLFVSTQSYLDAIYILRKHATRSELRQRCLRSLQFFETCDVEKAHLPSALKSDWPDVEDYIIAETAVEIGADYLITRDISGFKNSKVKALTPKSFIKLLEKEYGISYDAN